MAQQLILPINDMRFIVGYKVPIYKQEWKFPHYGIDCESVSGTREVRALGDGVVHSCGMDGATVKERMGLCIVVVYKNAQLPSGKLTHLACRMQHFDKILCKTGQQVKAGDALGLYGNTGQYSSGPHLHLEFDTDISAPAYAFGLGSSGKVIKKGTTDSTVDPSTIWHVGAGQSITAPASWVKQGYSSAKDTALPKLASTSTGGTDYKALYEKEKARADAAESKLSQVRALVG